MTTSNSATEQEALNLEQISKLTDPAQIEKLLQVARVGALIHTYICAILSAIVVCDEMMVVISMFCSAGCSLRR